MAPTNKRDLGKVIVIGGCGFLGHHIVDHLCEGSSYSAKVSVIDIRTTRNRRPDADGVRYIDGDITSLESLLPIFEDIKPDVVIHTASPPAVAELPKDFLYKVNVTGTRCVIEACQKTNVKALVYTSSAGIISDQVTDVINADERWPIRSGKNQPDYYADTKGQAEGYVIAANRGADAPKLLTVAIRPAGIFGEGDTQQSPGLLELYFRGRTNFQVGTNENLFDFTYAGNIAHAHLLAAAALLQTHTLTTDPLDHEKIDGEIFFITNDCPVYFWDWPRMLWKVAGLKQEIKDIWVLPREMGIPLAATVEFFAWLIRIETRFSVRGVKASCMARYYNISKAKQRLGYKPIFSLEEGAKRTVAWIIAEREKEAAKKTQ